MTLFPREQVVGIFRGFSEGGLEFHADLVLPYRNDFQNTPMHGQFLLVQLENENEGVLGRITSLTSEGRLVSGTGEDYSLRAVAEDREVPEDLREQYLKYRVDIRVLGVLRRTERGLVFAPSHRRLPHLGSKVAFLADDVLRWVAGDEERSGAQLGFLAFGEFVFGGGDERMEPLDWMQVRYPAVIPRFDISHLVSRRTFVFARAGFGKSNLNKLLFALLYHDSPSVEKRGGRRVPVGTVIFDPDGEYFWPDDKNRPGLCDVPELQDKLVVFTGRKAPSPFYGAFVAGEIKIDIRRLRPADVISIALSPERQDQQNVRKLKGLGEDAWRQLVDEIYANGNAADPQLIRDLLRLEPNQEAELVAARANMTAIVNMLHDPRSQMLDMLLHALRDGKLCIVDVSQMRGTPALVLAGIILQKIFDHNQQEFTEAQPATIPTIAVIEEAQAVLGSSGGSGQGPFVAWVKEGRKYDLGAVMITQQPGSISPEILSQGDNWFVFHLLAAGDLQALKRANAHFSDDLLSTLLNEPIPGHAVFWSSASGRGYPIPVRIFSFEKLYAVRDPDGTADMPDTYALRLRRMFDEALARTARWDDSAFSSFTADASGTEGEHRDEETSVDVGEAYRRAAIRQLQANRAFVEDLRRNGMPWGKLRDALADLLPDVLPLRDRRDMAYRLVARFLTETFGPQNRSWHTERRPRSDGGQPTAWVIVP